MQSETISFLSTLGAGWTEDMALLKNGLWLGFENREYAFRYFISKTKQKNDIAKKGWRLARNQFCEKASDIICADASLPANIRKLNPNGKKILMAAPYDVYFKSYAGIENRAMDEFTHFVAGSPFMEKILKKAYGIQDEKIIKNTALPLSWAMYGRHGEEAKKWLNLYFPETKEKKILMILLSGRQKRKIEQSSFSHFMDYMGEEWSVITNNMKLKEYDNRIIYTGRIMLKSGLLKCCDTMFTNDSYYAAAFSVTEKPVYCFSFSDCHFEKYMREHFCALCIEGMEQAEERLEDNIRLTEAQKKIAETFSYESPENPCAAIDSVLQD